VTTGKYSVINISGPRTKERVMKSRTTEVGNTSEAWVLAALIEAGYIVLQPFGDGCKYDFVIDDGIMLQRVQCKTGRMKGGCIDFNAYSVAGNSNGVRQTYMGLADLFAVYCPENHQVYMVPVLQVGRTQVRLRVENTRNSQRRRVRWAKDYQLLQFAPRQDENNAK
jgi:hypothetical protein